MLAANDEVLTEAANRPGTGYHGGARGQISPTSRLVQLDGARQLQSPIPQEVTMRTPIVISIALLLSLHVHGPVCADLKTEEIGGCLVVHLREGAGTAPDITRF